MSSAGSSLEARPALILTRLFILVKSQYTETQGSDDIWGNDAQDDRAEAIGARWRNLQDQTRSGAVEADSLLRCGAS